MIDLLTAMGCMPLWFFFTSNLIVGLLFFLSGASHGFYRCLRKMSSRDE